MTLITSVTSSVPTHLMQCTLLPSRICNELDRLNWNFLWGDSSIKKKLHAIKWDVVTKPKHLGGLRLKKSFPQNNSLLAKRAWAMHTNENTTWADTLWKKYLSSNTAKRKSTIWNNIQKSEPICKLGIRWLIRNGHTNKFWHDNWMGHGLLLILIQSPLHADDLHLEVKDTWDANSNWDFSTLSSSSHLTSKILFMLLPNHFTPLLMIYPLGIPLWMAASTFVQLIFSLSISPMILMPALGNGSGRSPQSQESRPFTGSPTMIISQPKPTFFNGTSSLKRLAFFAPQELKPHFTFFVTAPLSNPSGMSFQNWTSLLISLISTSPTGSSLCLPQHPTLRSFP